MWTMSIDDKFRVVTFPTAEAAGAAALDFLERSREVAPGGSLDRSALAARAFADEEDRSWLEALLWPLVGARAATWRSCSPRSSSPCSWT